MCRCPPLTSRPLAGRRGMGFLCSATRKGSRGINHALYIGLRHYWLDRCLWNGHPSDATPPPVDRISFAHTSDKLVRSAARHPYWAAIGKCDYYRSGLKNGHPCRGASYPTLHDELDDLCKDQMRHPYLLISSIRRIGTIARSRTSSGTFTSYWSWRRLSYTSSRLMSFIVRQCLSGIILTKVCCG